MPSGGGIYGEIVFLTREAYLEEDESKCAVGVPLGENYAEVECVSGDQPMMIAMLR